jgi:hypothetical protein
MYIFHINGGVRKETYSSTKPLRKIVAADPTIVAIPPYTAL